jgi:NADPH:quinone reductase and related Zn-dependent oxidoreductases
MDRETDRACLELRDQSESKAASGSLLVSLHESERRSVDRDHASDRRRIIRPVVDRVFPFASTKEAMAYVEAGRAKGKVVVSLK